MRIALKIFLLTALLTPAVCLGQTKCRWINEATAQGILGGPVTVTATISDQSEGVCEFTRKQESVTHQLRIAVNLMTDIPKQFPAYRAKCPAGSSPLRAIGNEAVSCSLHESGDHFSERVVGRVRDQAFVITVTSTAKDDASMSPELRREKANLVAEMVAGILF
jgi:hypothetical protein